MINEYYFFLPQDSLSFSRKFNVVCLKDFQQTLYAYLKKFGESLEQIKQF